MEDVMPRLGARLRLLVDDYNAARRRKGLRYGYKALIEEMRERLGDAPSYGHLADLCEGRDVYLSVKQLRLFSRFFDVPSDYFMTEDECEALYLRAERLTPSVALAKLSRLPDPVRAQFIGLLDAVAS